MHPKPNLIEAMGLTPWRTRLKQAAMVFRGAEDVPPMKWGLSGLHQLHPRISPYLWRGKPYLDRTVLVSNCFNRTQTPVEEGWSTLRTQVNDFRGRQLSYDSHNGVDFAIPIGTTVVAPAPGIVARVVSEFNRGGLKIFTDHGQGLMTTCAHLAFAKVKEGDRVYRGQTIGISGYSGIDALLTFPVGIPHVHFNTWLNGEPIDPFARDNEVSMWLGHHPAPAVADPTDTAEPSIYSPEAIARLIAGCRTPNVRETLEAVAPFDLQAGYALVAKNYYPTRFSEHLNPYVDEFERREALNLPFLAQDFDKLVFIDEI